MGCGLGRLVLMRNGGGGGGGGDSVLQMRIALIHVREKALQTPFLDFLSSQSLFVKQQGPFSLHYRQRL